MLVQRTFVLALAVAAGRLEAAVEGRNGLDPWAVLAPVVRLDEDERRRLGTGATVVRVLDPAEPSQLVVFAASRIDVTPQKFAERIRNSARLWQGPKVPRTGTFSTPASTGDVAEMTLQAVDLNALRRCRPGDCEVKLSDAEIARIDAAINRGAHQWKPAVQREFRAIMLERIAKYRQGGLAALHPFHDHDQPVHPRAVFSRLVEHARSMTAFARELTEYLKEYPRVPLPEHAEEYLYWLETVHPPKPMIQAWHVTIGQPPRGGAADVIVISRQIFATHYVNGALAMTALVQGKRGEQHMIYLNRVSADGLTGFLSGIRRFFIERRVKSGAGAAFDWVKRRIEE